MVPVSDFSTGFDFAFSAASVAFASCLATRFSSTRSTPARTCRRAASRSREGAEAVPALLAFEPVSIAPILRPWACNDQIEAIAIGILTGLFFALNTEWFQSACHVLSPVKTVLRTPGQKLRFAF